MRFGHYTVFDTPEENKHTQVYVEYDVPNNDNLDGATGTIVLTEGGQGSGGDNGSGIRSITISPAITTTPEFESLFPLYYGDERISGDEFTIELSTNEPLQTVSVTITPTEDVYIGAEREGCEEFTNRGEARTFEIEPVGNFILMSDFCFCTSTDYADAIYLNMTIESTN